MKFLFACFHALYNISCIWHHSVLSPIEVLIILAGRFELRLESIHYHFHFIILLFLKLFQMLRFNKETSVHEANDIVIAIRRNGKSKHWPRQFNFVLQSKLQSTFMLKNLEKLYLLIKACCNNSLSDWVVYYFHYRLLKCMNCCQTLQLI